MLKFCLKSISEKQHGFIPGRSTITNLILFTNSIFSSFDRNNQLDAIYLDFRKAFDLINHKILLLKLKKWLENYLSNRNSYVQIKGTKSRKFMAPSGVPQGSHLGPLLFLLFINEIRIIIYYIGLFFVLGPQTPKSPAV